MATIHNCKSCNYTTNIYSNYQKHLKTKKHILGVNIIESKRDSLKRISCKYCKKKISNKYHLKDHYSICLNKKVYDIENSKDKIIQILLGKNDKLNEKVDLLNNKIAAVTNQKKELETDYMECLKMNGKCSQTVTQNFTQNVIYSPNYNTAYVVNNFKEADVYKDLIDRELTKDEIKYIEKHGSIPGCFNLLKGRCIDNVPIEKRSIHCADPSRSKFLVKTKKGWETDYGGHIVFEHPSEKVRRYYENINNKESTSVEQISQNQKQIYELINEKQKINKCAGSFIILKNGVCNGQIEDIVKEVPTFKVAKTRNSS